MWLLHLQTPGRATLPGEAVDLGDIRVVKEKTWERDTPYSLARPDGEGQ